MRAIGYGGQRTAFGNWFSAHYMGHCTEFKPLWQKLLSMEPSHSPFLFWDRVSCVALDVLELTMWPRPALNSQVLGLNTCTNSYCDLTFWDLSCMLMRARDNCVLALAFWVKHDSGQRNTQILLSQGVCARSRQEEEWENMSSFLPKWCWKSFSDLGLSSLCKASPAFNYQVTWTNLFTFHFHNCCGT